MTRLEQLLDVTPEQNRKAAALGEEVARKLEAFQEEASETRDKLYEELSLALRPMGYILTRIDENLDSIAIGIHAIDASPGSPIDEEKAKIALREVLGPCPQEGLRETFEVLGYDCFAYICEYPKPNAAKG